MAIPHNITRDHILQAISKIDNEGIPSDGDSHYYDVLFNGKEYPPKLLVSYANLFANGTILDRSTFDGGLNRPCFKLLERSGFIIQSKSTSTNTFQDSMSYYTELKKFIEQSKTQDLKTSEYLKSYSNLRVEVSFGKGNLSRIPWIAFLAENQAVQKGIYPVYLLYKEKNLLILAYGVSETNKPTKDWDIPSKKYIQEYFLDNNLGSPPRYLKSYFFRSYNLSSEIDRSVIDRDLNDIIATYKSTQLTVTPQLSIVDFQYQQFSLNAVSAGLYFSNDIALRFSASLLTKPFVILTGLSGSGKTKLAQSFATWICAVRDQYCIVPVGADWTNREPLLGFPNALVPNEYKPDEYGVLQLILRAGSNPEKPYFLILDEMNLSHVERYFADFLSVMESKASIALHSGDQDWNGIPAALSFPKNLFIIGTVNIDETTYMFSPKVLDRANVIEFRVTEAEMRGYLAGTSVPRLQNLAGLGASMADSFVETAGDENLITSNSQSLTDALMKFFTELKKTGAEFGYRSASEILRFSAVVKKIAPEWKSGESIDDAIIDAAIMQKLLPKVHGSKRKLEPVLKTLGTLCLTDAQKFDDITTDRNTFNYADRSKVRYPLSLEKILRMYDNLNSNGFTSYAEA